MDCGDSSSSSPVAVNRDVAAAADDRGALSLISSLAKEAAILFQARKFAECLDLLVQLSQKKENDPKVLHNIAIAEFLRDGCSDHRKLIEVLINVKKKCEDLARSSGEKLEAASQLGNKTNPGTKETNSVGHQVSESSASVLYTDEFDSSVATLNMAVVLHHLHDHTRAVSILEPLFQNIDPIDEGTALHVCLLLLDLAVATQDALKLADVITYVEKAFSVVHMNQAHNGSIGPQPSNLVMKTSSVPVSTSTADDMNSDASATADASEYSFSRTLSDDTAEYETLLSTLDMSGQKLSRLTNLPSSVDLPRTPSDRLSSTDLKLKLPLFKVQLLFLTRSLKMAKRELKLAMNGARGRDSSSALLLKSQLELAGGNYVKAEKLLKASYNLADYGSSIIYNNNVGCIFYQWGKYNTAGVFFHRALVSCSSLRKERPCNLARFSQDKSLLIMYNSGLQYLACGNPILAAQCFQKATLVFYNKPLLWLRLAECSLLAFTKECSKSFDRLLCGPEFGVFVVGQGKWRQLAVEDGLTRKEHVNSSGREDSTLASDRVLPNLSLSFARQCLWTALDLVRRVESKSVKSDLPLKSIPEENEFDDVGSSKNSNHKHPGFGDSKGPKDTLSSSQDNANGNLKEQKGRNNVKAAAVSLSEYEDTCRRGNLKIKLAILVNLAFVELELGNPQAALSKACSILKMPECSRMWAFLAHAYAAEALCLLNKPQEAAEQLSVYFSGGSNIDLPYGKEDYEQWQVNRPLDSEELFAGPGDAKNYAAEGHNTMFYKPEEARGALYVNLAFMSAMRGDFEEANRYAGQALLLIPSSKEANLMGVYLDLKLGRVQEARVRLRRCNCVNFIPCDSRSKGSS